MDICVDWLIHKVCQQTYKSHDDEDQIAGLLFRLESTRHKCDMDLSTFSSLDRLKRSINQYMGTFWEKYLATTPGWENCGERGGIDLINKERKIVIELKNKHNTLNAASKSATISRLEAKIKEGYTAYIGVINPKKDSGSLKSRHKNSEVLTVSGIELFKLVLGNDYNHTQNMAAIETSIVCAHNRYIVKTLVQTIFKNVVNESQSHDLIGSFKKMNIK